MVVTSGVLAEGFRAGWPQARPAGTNGPGGEPSYVAIAAATARRGRTGPGPGTAEIGRRSSICTARPDPGARWLVTQEGSVSDTTTWPAPFYRATWRAFLRCSSSAEASRTSSVERTMVSRQP